MAGATCLDFLEHVRTDVHECETVPHDQHTTMNAIDRTNGIKPATYRILTAALRALENREGSGALFADPLAGVLADPDAVRQAEAYAEMRSRASAPQPNTHRESPGALFADLLVGLLAGDWGFGGLGHAVQQAEVRANAEVRVNGFWQLSAVRCRSSIQRFAAELLAAGPACHSAHSGPRRDGH